MKTPKKVTFRAKRRKSIKLQRVSTSSGSILSDFFKKITKRSKNCSWVLHKSPWHKCLNNLAKGKNRDFIDSSASFSGPISKNWNRGSTFFVSREKLSFRISNNELNWPKIVELWPGSVDVFELTCYIFSQNLKFEIFFLNFETNSENGQ